MINKKNIPKIKQLIIPLFIFNMINREFRIIGIDPRYVVIVLSLFSLYHSLFVEKINIKHKYLYKWSILFIGLLLFSTLVNWNIEYIDINERMNLLILYTYNILFILHILTIPKITVDSISNIVLFSVFVLLISFFMSYFNNDHPIIFSEIKGIYRGNHMKNLLGLPFRVSGYAQDPNYASFSLVISMILIFYSTVYRKSSKIIIIAILSFAYCFTASKTIIVALFMSIIFTGAIKTIKRNTNQNLAHKFPKKRILLYFILITTFLIPIFFILFGIDKYVLNDYSTMSQRYAMWRNSLDLFLESPLYGKGIGSARSYYGLVSRVVQIHSTPIQIISEFGLMGIAIIILLYLRLLYSKDNRSIIITFVFIIFGLTYETIQLQYLPFLILVYISTQFESNIKYDIVFVNSLSGGGAEVVAKNLVKNLLKDSRVILFVNNYADEFKEAKNISVIKLSQRNIFKNIFLINSIIEEVGFENIISSSTHLFKSHFNTSLSLISFESLYYFHGTIDSTPNTVLMKILYKIVYFNKKLVFLNKEIQDEFEHVFKLKNKQRFTSKNFIDFEYIDNKAKGQNINVNEPYMLFIGRLEDIKDPLLAIKSFAEIANKIPHTLYILGEGSLTDSLIIWVNDNKMNERIKFMGFVDNPYVWIKNSDVVLVTSKFESDSLVIMESLHLGSRVVSTNCNYGPKYILTNDLSEFLVSSRDEKIYSDIIMKALERYPTNYSYIYEGRSVNEYIKKLRDIYRY